MSVGVTISPLVLTSAVVVLVVGTVGLTVLAHRFGWSAPLALVAVGAGISFLPLGRAVVIDPDLILYGLLPPLLFASAIRASLIDMRTRRDPILLTSIGLVVFTVVVVGLAAWLLIPAITVAAGLAFGAVVAPTDSVAVDAVTRRARLPRILSTLLDGENLLNDATALVALNAAIAAILNTLSPTAIAGDFVLAAGGGTAVGLCVGFVIASVRRRLRVPVLDTTLSLVTPYLAFTAAQWLHGSGILAVVVAGLYLGYRAPVVQSAEARIAETLNWRTIQYLLENAVFLLIGLSLAGVLAGAADSGLSPWQIALITLALLGILTATRLVWGLVVTAAFHWGPPAMRRISWHWNQNVPFTLAGIRGVVTLAAVLLLPDPTPQRELLQLLAVLTVVGTLLQGLLLPLTVRRLRLAAPNPAQERMEIEQLLSEAQAAGLRRLETDSGTATVDPRVIDRLRTNGTFLAGSLAQAVPGEETLHETYVRVRRMTLDAERQAVLRARQERRYQEAAVRDVLRLIDADETALKVVEE